MTDLVATLPVVNGTPMCGGCGQFPVRHVCCVGHNYAAHACGMGFGPDREPSFFFCKPADAVCYVVDSKTGQFVYPTETEDYHYEIELVVAIGTDGHDITVEATVYHVYGYAIGLDMTRRDLQNTAKRGGRPWEIGKAFDDPTPIDPIMPAKDVTHPDKGAVILSASDHEHQRDDLSDLIQSVSETTAYLPHLFKLRPGDLIYTGTSEGVGPAVVDDLIVGKINDVRELHVKVI